MAVEPNHSPLPSAASGTPNDAATLSSKSHDAKPQAYKNSTPEGESLVCIVDFHHARGPEIEAWIGVEDGVDPAAENEWTLLPFMALSDGAHAVSEDFSYFTLRRAARAGTPSTSLFGIACTRQLGAHELINKPADVTRSTVQKAIVAILNSPKDFGRVREKLSFVTRAWFHQKDFTDRQILEDFRESLVAMLKEHDEEKDNFFGLALREIIHDFKHQTLVLFKCLLLQPKALFFGSHCERICLLQFSLISLIPRLLRSLQDCADPAFNSCEENHIAPTSLKTSERASLLSYVGLPLQIFGKGSIFGPYTPLQQLDMLAENTTKSYMVGSTNSILLSQTDKYADVLINVDDNTVTICNPALKPALALTVPDRRWIDFLANTVHETWDEEHPDRPKTLGYAGSEEFLRLQFEEYLLALLSSVKYRQFISSKHDSMKSQPLVTDVEGDPSAEFGHEWVKAWMKSENYRIFNHFTDGHIFDIIEPHHPCSGGLTVEDVQRRLASQVAELHLDEKYQVGKETLNRHLTEGREKVSTALTDLWTNIEARREAQRQRAAELKEASPSSPESQQNRQQPAVRIPKAPDFSNAQANISAASKSAGAYISSWGAWAAEKRTGWGKATPTSGTTPVSSRPSSPKQSHSSYVHRQSGSIGRRALSSSSLGSEKDLELAKESLEPRGTVPSVAASTLGNHRLATDDGLAGWEMGDVDKSKTASS